MIFKAADEKCPHAITPSDLRKLNITTKLIETGFIFIWVEKQLIAEVLDVMLEWGFKYVENLIWVRENIDNTIRREPHTYFNKSKSTLLMCRKVVVVVGGGGWWWWLVVVVGGGGWWWWLVVVVGGGGWWI